MFRFFSPLSAPQVSKRFLCERAVSCDTTHVVKIFHLPWPYSLVRTRKHETGTLDFFFSLLLTWIREFLFENTAERGRMIIVQRRDYLLQHLYSPRKRDVINLAMRRTISLVEKTAANAYLSLLRSLWYQTGRKSVARIFTSISRNFSRSEFRCATGVLKENYDFNRYC